MYKLIQDDCLEALKSLEDNSIDSLVTDPPAGISFIGLNWDSNKGGRDEWINWMTEVMRECYRVLKPGAHGLVWALPRTSGWTSTALENAGFEVRDVITHLFGQGFPKGQNISKAIDKAAGIERPRIPGGQNKESKIIGTRKAGEAISDEAKQWEGWGTSLKPSSEHWILVRKPISEKTIAANVLKWGTGGLNIDGCRVGGDILRKHMSKVGIYTKQSEYVPIPERVGRFPSNVVLSHSDGCNTECASDCVVKELDEQSGITKGTGKVSIGAPPRTPPGRFFLGLIDRSQVLMNYGDSGGASRFFYCAKVSAKDRGANNNHPTVKSTVLMGHFVKLITPPNGTILDPFMGSGSTGLAALRNKFNFIGIEKDLNYYAIAKSRLESEDTNEAI